MSHSPPLSLSPSLSLTLSLSLRLSLSLSLSLSPSLSLSLSHSLSLSLSLSLHRAAILYSCIRVHVHLHNCDIIMAAKLNSTVNHNLLTTGNNAIIPHVHTCNHSTCTHEQSLYMYTRAIIIHVHTCMPWVCCVALPCLFV